MRARTLATLMVALLLAWPVAAQETRGAIEGSVKDSSGAVLPGATVEAKSPSANYSSVTDPNGMYRFPAVIPGTYEITATLQGFSPAKREDVNVVVGQLLKVDLSMALQGVTETVSVTAESPTIDVKQTTAATNIRQEMIDLVPKARDFAGLVQMAPGANIESRFGSGGSGLSIDGASASENKFFIDGVDTTNLRTGVSGTPFLTDFIDQVQVKSSGYAAEFGGSTGGVVSVISKSGSNSLRGQVGTYFLNDALISDPRPSLRLVLSGANQSEYVTYPEDTYSRWEPNGQLGGPIARDKAWYWVGYNPQLENTERTVTFRSNGQTGTYKSKETTNNFSGNVSNKWTQGLTTKVSGSYRYYHQDGRLPAIDGTSNPATKFADLGTKNPNGTFTANADYVASNKLFLNAKANYLRYNTVDVGIPAELWYSFNGSNAIYDTRADKVKANGYSNLLTNRARTRDIYNRIGGSADATFYASAGGQHTFKGGVQFERIGNDVLDQEQRPRITLVWNQSLSTLDGRTVRGQYGYYTVRQFGTVGNVHVNNLGLFIQDQWSVNDRLTLNLGVRTERETVPSYKDGLNGFEFSFADKLAPRAGFAYDIKGDGRWKVYGSWGVFYDTMKLELPRGAFGGDKWLDYRYSLDTLDWDTIGVNDVFPGTFYEVVDFRIPSNDPSCPECGAINKNLKPFRSQEAVGGFEHEFTPRLSGSVRYVHKQVDRAIEDIGVIVPGVGEVFFIGNPGEDETKFLLGPEFPAQPKPVRDYDAVEFKFNRRFADNWMFNASYTLSRLYGNYPGLANSDEIGRLAPNVTRLFDTPYMSFDQNGKAVYGRLNTDRPNVVKLQGAYRLPTDTEIGAVFTGASGIPITRQVNVVTSAPVFYAGRLSDGRTPIYLQTNLQLLQNVRLGSGLRAQVVMNVDNLFDQKRVLDVWRPETRQTVPMPGATEEERDHAFFNGFDVQQIINQRNILRDPRFLLPSTYQGQREIRIGLKLLW